jgi:hypothetical protein
MQWNLLIKLNFPGVIVNKKTEQEIGENMYNNESADEHDANAEVYEMNIKTNPVIIKVKPLPGRNAADTFAGAIGNFSINAFVEKDTILRNEENSLNIEINGAGNFQSISAPFVKWPQAIEAFEPSITDTLDKQLVPLTGQRRFNYIFLSDKPGKYTIPAISFSFFNLKTKTYKNVSTKPLTIFVSSKNKQDNILVVEPMPTSSKNKTTWWFSAVSLLILLAGIFLWLKNKQASAKKEAKQKEKTNENLHQLISIEELLKPVELVINNDGKIFYNELNHAIWNYFNQCFQLSGSEMNKTALAKILIVKGINPGKTDELVRIIHQCESGIYTNAEIDLNRKELLRNTKQILKEIEGGFK